MSTTRKILETPSGIGKVYKDAQELAKVDYKLTISQQFTETITSEGRSTVPGLKEITGQFKIILGSYLSIDGTVLNLHLADGRQWKFILVDASQTGIYTAANAPGGASDF
jgi:hypothetical protein